MLRVLIAEDDSNSLLILKRFVESHAECDTAVDGADALEKYLQSLEEDRPYQLIFLDIMMPKMNGIEVMEQIRDRELQSGVLGDDAVSIVMTTAVDDEQKIFEAHVTGCFNYLIKPLDKKSVVEQLKFVEKSNPLEQ